MDRLDHNISRKELEIICKSVNLREQDKITICGTQFPAKPLKQMIKTFKKNDELNVFSCDKYIQISWKTGSATIKAHGL